MKLQYPKYNPQYKSYFEPYTNYYGEDFTIHVIPYFDLEHGCTHGRVQVVDNDTNFIHLFEEEIKDFTQYAFLADKALQEYKFSLCKHL